MFDACSVRLLKCTYMCFNMLCHKVQVKYYTTYRTAVNIHYILYISSARLERHNVAITFALYAGVRGVAMWEYMYSISSVCAVPGVILDQQTRACSA